MTDIFILAAVLLVLLLNIILLLKNFGAGGVKQALADLEKMTERNQKLISDGLTGFREEIATNARENRLELSQTLKAVGDSLSKQVAEMAMLLKTHLDLLIRSNNEKLDGIRAVMEDRLTKLQEQLNQDAGQNRAELVRALKSFAESFRLSVAEFNEHQQQKFTLLSAQLEKLITSSEDKLNKMRDTLEAKLASLQQDNADKLEKIRLTVDEKLQSTLEKRLGESFHQVSQRLEQVHRGLGEMQALASGVGDLKKALVNVKVRGTLGELQLENILEQIFAPTQYEKNVAVVPQARERVEFAVKLPGKDDEHPVLLPIDSKFPLEDYHRLLDAYENAAVEQIEACAKKLEASIKRCAKDIKEKYIRPPYTTDFAIMFLAFEGLYAEVLRRNGLFETLMREYKVAVTGPTTLAAFLTSLQMGFKTLTIEKRSSEVWELLGTVKAEFSNFGALLEKTKRKLQEASDTIDGASRKSRTIERKLKKVQELPAISPEKLEADVTIDDDND
ncbi:MAG: DNA recombination protein RmuC [Firmicutes bacterium]|nr:DNA recombination protein RmuC [Bacillota bacterium]